MCNQNQPAYGDVLTAVHGHLRTFRRTVVSMPNQRLRNALAAGGMTQADSGRAGRGRRQERRAVDHPGPLPHPATRASIAHALGPGRDLLLARPARHRQSRERDRVRAGADLADPQRRTRRGLAVTARARPRRGRHPDLRRKLPVRGIRPGRDHPRPSRPTAPTSGSWSATAAPRPSGVRSSEEGRPAIGERCRSSLEYISVVADLARRPDPDPPDHPLRQRVPVRRLDADQQPHLRVVRVPLARHAPAPGARRPAVRLLRPVVRAGLGHRRAGNLPEHGHGGSTTTTTPPRRRPTASSPARPPSSSATARCC